MSTSSARGSGHRPEPLPTPIPVTDKETLLSTLIIEGVTLLQPRPRKPLLTRKIHNSKGDPRLRSLVRYL